MDNKFDLNFQTCNNEGKNLLVCLHGNSTDSNYFSTLLKGVEGWRVVAPDYIGHGSSPSLAPDDYNFDVFIRCLVEFIEPIRYDKLVIIGHSMGGNLATELMKVIPLDGLLLLSAPPVSYSSDLAPYLKLPNIELSESHNENVSRVEAYLSGATSDEMAMTYLTQTFLNTDPVFRVRLLEEFDALKFSDQLEILKQNNSTLIGSIMADDDTEANNVYLNQLSGDNIFDYCDRIPDAGHYSLIEKPRQVKNSILNFLTGFNGR